MKKRHASICISVIAALIGLMIVFYATPEDSFSTVPSSTTSYPATMPTYTVPTLPSTESTPTITLPATTLPPVPGVVRLYTCDAEVYDVYVSLAAEYYAQTGIEVQILTPPADTACQDALLSLLTDGAAPSIFCIHSEEMLSQLQQDLYDLAGTAIVEALYSQNFALQTDGKLVALAADVAGSGLIYNASKLASAGFTETDISSFAGLKTTVSHITANRNTLGYAFAAPDFSDEHLMEHLAGLYPDTAQLRSFLDLYFKNCTVQTTTLKYFLNGTTVFYIGGTSDYEKVASIGTHNLRFLPAYSEDTAAVQCFSDHYWAVNAHASEADIQASLDFWVWLVTAEDGSAPIDQLGMLSPYRQAGYAGNKLEQILRAYISDGNVYLTWGLSGKITDLDAFIAALKTYKANPSDENWTTVSALFNQFI